MKNEEAITVGIVGLGLMGASIASAMTLFGNKVVGVSPVDTRVDREAPQRILRQIEEALQRKMVSGAARDYFDKLKISDSYGVLAGCDLVIESVVEDLAIKEEVLKKIEGVVDEKTIIGTNTSAIPINTLQQSLIIRDRFFGLHWSEPVFTSRFLEIICGDESDQKLGEEIHKMAHRWNKEPTLVRKDIRGFVTNRLMYALYREAFYLVENGYASMADIDRACRNDGGVWMAFCGPFRYMDLTGLQAYYKVMKDLFPTLSDRKSVPAFVEQIAEAGGNGISNGHGFYNYSKEEALEWERAYADFAFDIAEIKENHPPKSLKDRT